MPQSASTSTTSRRILIIFNPIAGNRSGGRLERVIAALRARGLSVTLKPTGKRGDAEAFARELSPADYDVVVAAGGDGTINEVANGLSSEGPPLAIIPLGTANVLAAEIALPKSAEAIAEVIATGEARQVNVGIVNDRRFLLMAGVGFDAHVVANVDPAIKKAVGKLAYVWETFRGLFKFPFKTYRITIDGIPYEAASAVIANGRFYGGTFTCAPEARLEEQAFHVCLFLKGGRLQTMLYAAWLAMGRLHKRHDIKIVRGSEVVIDGPADEPVQGDGDILATLKADAKVAPKMMRLVMPA
ncbi:MAG: diacylglycerol/lipid kinase family protein [Magnetovibrionaceae bacterium]